MPPPLLKACVIKEKYPSPSLRSPPHLGDALAQEGCCIDEADIALLPPARSAHLNPYGKFDFDVERELRRKGSRPLR